MTRDDERNIRVATHSPGNDIAEKPAPVKNDDIGSGDGAFQVPREPQRAAGRVLDRHGIRSDRSRPVRVGRIEQRGDLDAMTREGFAPTSRRVRRARLPPEQVLLVVNDSNLFLRRSLTHLE